MFKALLSTCYSGLFLLTTIACFEQSLLGVLLPKIVFVSLCVVHGLLLSILSDFVALFA